MQLEKLHEFVSMLNVTIEFAEYMLQPDFVVLWRVFNPWDIEEKYEFAAMRIVLSDSTTVTSQYKDIC